MRNVLAAFTYTIREVEYNLDAYTLGMGDDVVDLSVSRVARFFVHLTTTRSTRFVN